MPSEKIRHAVDNYINGNIGDFKREIKQFRKYEIVDLILHVELWYSGIIEPCEFKRRLSEYLKN